MNFGINSVLNRKYDLNLLTHKTHKNYLFPQRKKYEGVGKRKNKTLRNTRATFMGTFIYKMPFFFLMVAFQAVPTLQRT